MGSFWNDERPMKGMLSCNEREMQCRHCIYAEKEHIGRDYCEKYPYDIFKPDDVYFGNAPCKMFEKGEDLLPYEIEIL